MKRSLIILFSLRLFLYFSVITLIFIHPGISVSFDRIGLIQWFLVIPLMAITAFIPEQIVKMRYKRIFYLSFLSVLSLIAGVSIIGALKLFAAGLTSFMLTALLFNEHRTSLYARLVKLTSLEPFFFAWVCLRLLSLSRSGEDIAGQSMMLTEFILVWTMVVFLLHCAVIYLCIYPKSYKSAWKEGLVFFSGALALLIVLLVVLPQDFVRNTIIDNLRSERIPQKIGNSDLDRGIPQRGGGRRTLPRGQNGQNQSLRGLSEHDWPGRGGGAGETRQYMVKIVASQVEPVYMGNVFRGRLDPIDGFLSSREEPLNYLAEQRLFVTWSNNEPENDFGRQKLEVISLSTMQQKYLPWRPVVVDPIILNENAGPLRFIHQVVSNIHLGDPLLLVSAPTRRFSEREKNALAHYLEIPLEADDILLFTGFLNDALDTWQKNKEAIIRSDRYLQEIFSDTNLFNDSGTNEYMEIIIALLVSFSQYQYNLTYGNEYSIDVLKYFLFDSEEGDCVEFSNTLALLGRLAGIPSRVVTGYLVADGLQTMAHLRGLAALRESIPYLQQFDFNDLFLVTNIHGHSWTQFYIPDFGWLDFEATSFSLPPEGMGDFNNWDVVIPILDSERVFSQLRKFPWRAVGRVAITLVVLAIISAYALRYTRELILYIGARRGGRKGVRKSARSLYLLLLTRLAADGSPIKPASKTAYEYSELFANSCSNGESQFKTFAGLYSELRWRQFVNPADEDERYQLLLNEYEKILSMRKSGLHHVIKRIFSLRGLAYL
ncbi:MAG: transglutaminase domain-containing protein [Treponema sp.]|jgi:hypothetical protein|nr:transglutaminase domain-containing protein [Treponema sp.]